MWYLLDANAVIALPNDRDGRMSRHIRAFVPSDFALPSIVAHELYFGACKSRRRGANLALVDNLLFEVVSFDREDARHAGDIRAALSTQGIPFGGYDVLIAGQARARALTLITRTVREFQWVDGLRIENWEDD